jgi:hypothetical protein
MTYLTHARAGPVYYARRPVKTDNERARRVRDCNALRVIYYLYRVPHVRVVVLLQYVYMYTCVCIVTRTSIKYLIGPLFGMRRPTKFFFSPSKTLVHVTTGVAQIMCDTRG